MDVEGLGDLADGPAFLDQGEREGLLTWPQLLRSSERHDADRTPKRPTAGRNQPVKAKQPNQGCSAPRARVSLAQGVCRSGFFNFIAHNLHGRRGLRRRLFGAVSGSAQIAEHQRVMALED